MFSGGLRPWVPRSAGRSGSSDLETSQWPRGRFCLMTDQTRENGDVGPGPRLSLMGWGGGMHVMLPRILDFKSHPDLDTGSTSVAE